MATEPEDIAALHLAARRYCTDRHAHWCDVYDQQRKVSSAPYSVQDYRVFPRYLVLGAILTEIERWVPAEASSVEDARARLVTAARTAADAASANIAHPAGVAAQAEERVALEQFLVESTPQAWRTAQPLPYRRILAKEETDALYEAFKQRWGIWYGGYADRTELPPYLTLHIQVWDRLPVEAALRDFLTSRGIDRVFELAELGPSCECEPDLPTFQYGSETLRFVAGCPWMIYASHESSITFGGAELVEHLRAALPRLGDYDYRGWDDLPSERHHRG